MRNLKKRFWVIAFVFSLLLCGIEYNSMVEFVSRRSYETCTEEELTEAYVTTEFTAGEELQLEEEWTILIKDFPYFKEGYLHKGVLTDSRQVLVVSQWRMGYFEPNTPIRGMFIPMPEEVSYLVAEYEVEPYVFYCFENYLSRIKPKLIVFFAGIVGAFLSLCGLLWKVFPNLFSALFKKEERTGTSNRDSNFELLRILCMIMIIMHHLGIWGDFDVSGEITGNTMILQCLVNTGKIGVNCLMMITGYYCAFSTFKPSKITKLVGQVWFYTWTIGIILFSTGLGIRSVENVQKSVFPICSGTFWFITIYLIVYVLSPYINQIIDNIDQQKYKTLLVFLFIIWSVFPSIVRPGWEFSNTGWLIFMYLLGAYFKKFPETFANCKLKSLWVFMGTYTALMCLTFLWNKNGGAVVYHQGLAQKHTVPIVICSAALFVLFKNMNIGQRKIINKIAASTFAVYLIHENPVLNDLLWTEWFKVNTYFENGNFIWYALGTVLLIYVSCTAIDMVLRQVWNACKAAKCILIKNRG